MNERRTWKDMHRRCTDPRCSVYDYYGGRGIRVCKQWQSFEKFFADMGPRPSADHSIDRKNVNGNYTPKNCRWATQSEQKDNRRRTLKIEFRGERVPLAKVLREQRQSTSLRQNTFKKRLDLGWDAERALSKPVAKRGEYVDRFVTIVGIKMSLHAAAEKLGIKYHTVRYRIVMKGWDPYVAVTTPARRWSRR